MANECIHHSLLQRQLKTKASRGYHALFNAYYEKDESALDPEKGGILPAFCPGYRTAQKMEWLGNYTKRTDEYHDVGLGTTGCSLLSAVEWGILLTG